MKGWIYTPDISFNSDPELKGDPDMEGMAVALAETYADLQGKLEWLVSCRGTVNRSVRHETHPFHKVGEMQVDRDDKVSFKSRSPRS